MALINMCIVNSARSSRGWVCYRGRSCRLAGPCATSTLGSGHGPGNPLSGTRRSLPKSSPEHRLGQLSLPCYHDEALADVPDQCKNNLVLLRCRTKNQMIGGSGSCASTPPRTLLECPRFPLFSSEPEMFTQLVW